MWPRISFLGFLILIGGCASPLVLRVDKGKLSEISGSTDRTSAEPAAAIDLVQRSQLKKFQITFESQSINVLVPRIEALSGEMTMVGIDSTIEKSIEQTIESSGLAQAAKEDYFETSLTAHRQILQGHFSVAETTISQLEKKFGRNKVSTGLSSLISAVSQRKSNARYYSELIRILEEGKREP